MSKGWQIFESLMFFMDDIYDVMLVYGVGFCGYWIKFKYKKIDMMLFYFYGGGYIFGGEIVICYVQMFCYYIGVEVFVMCYCLMLEYFYFV